MAYTLTREFNFDFAIDNASNFDETNFPNIILLNNQILFDTVLKQKIFQFKFPIYTRDFYERIKKKNKGYEFHYHYLYEHHGYPSCPCKMQNYNIEASEIFQRVCSKCTELANRITDLEKKKSSPKTINNNLEYYELINRHSFSFYKDNIIIEVETVVDNYNTKCLKITKQRLIRTGNEITTNEVNKVTISGKEDIVYFLIGNKLICKHRKGLTILDLTTFDFNNINEYNIYQPIIVKADNLLVNNEKNIALYNITLNEIIPVIDVNNDGYYELVELMDDYFYLNYNYDYNGGKGFYKNSILLKLRNINDLIPDDMKCVICFKKTEKNRALVPCGHRQYCNNCIKKIKTCSLCRKDISSIISLY